MDKYETQYGSPRINIDESIKKLVTMGFTNENEVRNALESTNFDINQAISLIICNNVSRCDENVEENSECAAEPTPAESLLESSDKHGSVSESTELQIHGHDLNIEFSSAEFNQLRARVFTDQWDIPCLRSQPLGKCLLGAIHELREHGMKAFDMNPECREFAFNCLPECVNKLMTSQAVYNWDRDTLEGVHNMLELTVRLVCQYFIAFKEALTGQVQKLSTADLTTDTKAAEVPQSALSRIAPSAGHFALESLRLLALIFDCEANYHQLCRDRNSNTGTYADPFNDWSSVAEQLVKDSTVFAETLPTPRNFYLVNLVNCFGVFDGFKFLRWLGIQPWTSVNLITSLLLPLTKCADYLTVYTLHREFGMVVMKRALWRLSNLCEDDFKDRDSRIFEVVTCIRVLTYRLADLNIVHCLAPFLLPNDESGDYHCFNSIREPDWEALSSADATSIAAMTSGPSSLLSASVAVAEVDRLHCTLLLAALSPPRGSAGASFNGRMLALRNLVEQLEAARLVSEVASNQQNSRNENLMAAPMRRRKIHHQYSSATLLASENATFLARRAKRRTMRLDYLMNWIREREVILKSLHNLDNTAYMTTLGQLFRLLGERLTVAELTTMWHRTNNQTGAAVDNILTLLTDVASTRFVQPQLEHLFYLVEASWMNLNRQAQMIWSNRKQESTGHSASAARGVCLDDEPSHVRHARARLLNLVGRIGIAAKEAWKADMCVELLWHIAHGTFSRGPNADSSSACETARRSPQIRSPNSSSKLPSPCDYKHPEPIEAALAQQLVVLREFRCSGVDQRLRAIRWLTQAVEHVSKNSLTFFMLAYVKSLVELILKNFVGRAKRDNLNELIRSHDLITQVVASLLRYEQWAIQSYGELLSADSQDELGFRHSEVVKRHFELLHYLLKNAEINLNVERAKSLWTSLIGHPRSAAYDREQCFAWFTASLSYLEPEAQTILFTKLMLKSQPALFRSYAGFECFKAFFEKVNLHEGRMKQVSKLWHVDKPDLIGLDFLWDLYLALPSSDASLDGVHMMTVPGDERIPTESNHKVSVADQQSDLATPRPGLAIGLSRIGAHSQSATCVSDVVEPNAVKMARQLLLDVHWGQLAPKLRRDPEACYKRFFDACRRRLEANWAVGRGLVSKRGVHSALAETGQLLAALIIGPGPASRAKHCSRTAARLALRRLLGLVYAYIQAVEDEMFGSKVMHPTWRPHGTTFRGWELRLPLRVETLRPGQISPVAVRLTAHESAISGLFSPFDTSLTPSRKSPEAAQPISLLIHSNEMLASVRDRSNLISTALLFANRFSVEGIGSVSGAVNVAPFQNWTASALYLGTPCVPDGPLAHSNPVVAERRGSRGSPISRRTSTTDQAGFPSGGARLGSVELCSKKLLETVFNRKPVGELGFQNGRQLIIRLIAGLSGGTNPRAGNMISTSPSVASALAMSLGSACPSIASMSATQGNTSETDLVARAAAALHTGADDPDHSTLNRYPMFGPASTATSASTAATATASSMIIGESPSSVGCGSSAIHSRPASGVQIARGISMLSLSSTPVSCTTGAASTIDLTAPGSGQPTPVTTTNLPSLCLGEDLSVYELLIELAESELVHLPMFPSTDAKRSKPVISGLPGSSGVSLSSSFSLIHPIRLLLATLPTCPAGTISKAGNQLQQSLYCSPTTLLKSTPYRTLYKLQVLSASLIPVDTTPWWDISPGCLLSPPSQLHTSSASAPTALEFAGNSRVPLLPSRSSAVEKSDRPTRTNVVDTSPAESDTHFQLTPSPNPQWFLSSESFGFGSQAMLGSTSAPSSPVFRRRRNFKLFGHPAVTQNEHSALKARQSVSSYKTPMTLTANVSAFEYLEPLVQLLNRQIEGPDQDTDRGVLGPVATSFSSQMQSTLAANIAWWRREVRHLCLQLLAFLLNPYGNHLHGESGLLDSRSFRQSVVSMTDSNCSQTVLHRFLTPNFASELLSALLNTAVASAGVTEQLVSHPHQCGPIHSTQTGLVTQVYQPNKDSRAGVAGLIEVTTPNGQHLLYQDVEVAVQSINLLVQCVLAYPSQMLESFLGLDGVEDKLLQLLIYSPSSRVRSETARQLEHLSLLCSRHLRLGEQCARGWDPLSRSDSSFRCETADGPCLTHTHIAHPKLLQFLLRIPFSTKLPLYSPPRIYSELNCLATLLANSAEYFRIRGFLIGQTPVALLKTWLKTDHVTLLRDEFSWFRAAMESEWNTDKAKHALIDSLLAGHLESARLICAQTVAGVISHTSCTFSSWTLSVTGAATTTFLASRDNLRRASHGSLGGGGAGGLPNTSNASCDSRGFLVPAVLLEALSDENEETKDQSVDQDTGIPLVCTPEDFGIPGIAGPNALIVCTQCVRVARQFVSYLLTECLFPAASHILKGGNFKGSNALETSLLSLRALEPLSLRVSWTSRHADDGHEGAQMSSPAQMNRMIKGVGPMTKRTAYAFLLLLVRVDLCSLERVVDLLILLHHNYDVVQTGLLSAISSAGPSSAIATPDNLSARTSPRASQVLLSEETANKQRISESAVHKEISWDVQPVLVGRAESGFVGLRNGGATCYMNAVLQQVFMQPGLAEALLSITETDDLDENNILFQTQKLFGNLLQSQLEYYDPAGFWQNFRPWDTSEALNPREQQDAFDFFQAFIDQLDEELKKLKREPFFQAIYQGIFLDSKFCDECEHRYDREEVFSAINLAVRVHDLQEALNQFVRGEVLDGDNAYYCERCRVKRRTVKRMSVHTLPPVLCLHLKRFDFDWDRQVPIKFSDPFTFPRQLDMGPYMSDSVQKLRPEAFFSPSSSTSSLLQREARVAAPSTAKQAYHLSDSEFGEECSQNGPVLDGEPRELRRPDALPGVNYPTSAEVPRERPAFDLGVPTHGHSTPSVYTIPSSGSVKKTHGITISAPTNHLYQLVGIIVHSGQANSGHYYAFIKDRGRADVVFPSDTGEAITSGLRVPSSPSQLTCSGKTGIHKQRASPTEHGGDYVTQQDNQTHGLWYRFNDTSVEPVELDDATLEHECFGGTYKVTSADGRSTERRTRYWSAYMLFYERVDLNHAALRQSLLTKQSNTLAAEPPIPVYHGPMPSLVVDNVRSDRAPSNAENNTDSAVPDCVNFAEATHIAPGSVHDAPEPDQSRICSLPRLDTSLSCEHACQMPKRISHQIWAENWAFLRNRNIYSRDYFDAIRGLCEGILVDSNSLRQEPQRGVIGTRLLSHFIFHTFLSLHPRAKVSIEGCVTDARTASTSALKEMANQLNSEWLGLLIRLASTSPKACRWLMHFLCTSPAQPCFVFLLQTPKPAVRQQLANTVFTVLRTFYAFRETNILDGTLTGLINHLLSFLDNGLAAEYAAQSGALFAMLRSYAEMCPHASLHLINLKTTRHLLSYLMEPRIQEDSVTSMSARGGSFSAGAPTWADRLRVWTPTEQREMGNLYYLLALLILQTSLDEYRTIRPISSSPAHPVLLTVPNVTNTGSGHSTKPASWGRLMLRPHKETVTWLGITPFSTTIPHTPMTTSTGTKNPSQSQTFQAVVSSVPRSDSGPTEETYLVGLYRLSEILLRAYLENAATPSLTGYLGLTEVSRTVSGVSATTSAPESTVINGNTGATAGGTNASGRAAVNGPPSQAANKSGEESMPLRQLVIQTMLYMAYCWWESSFCFIINLLSRISTRPQSELRHLFDLLNELLCLVDPLQSARIAAVMDGFVNRPARSTEPGSSLWCPRPSVDPHLWAWNPRELDLSLEMQEHSETHLPSPVDKNVIPDSDEVPLAASWPPMPKGLLDLITTEAYRDSRRAYQCMKFIVHLSSKTDAVMSYLSGFPERWEPAVRWLENLMESVDESGAARSTTGSAAGLTNPVGAARLGSGPSVFGMDEADTGGLCMIIPSTRDASASNPRIKAATSHPVSESTGRPGNLINASNESEENTSGFQRTVSAQTTLHEATRILFTMPRVRPESIGLSSLPVSGGSTHRQSNDADDEDYEPGAKPALFYKLS